MLKNVTAVVGRKSSSLQIPRIVSTNTYDLYSDIVIRLFDENKAEKQKKMSVDMGTWITYW